MAKPKEQYKKQDNEMSTWFSDADSSYPTINLNQFKYSDGSTIAGITKICPWQRERDDIAEFYNDGTVDSFKPVYAGDSPKFTEWVKVDTAGTYKLYVKDNKLLLSNKKTTNAVDFRDGVIPNRMVLFLQAGGGGGGSSSDVFAAGWCIGGANGGAGGSGAAFAVVLNTELLKVSESNYFEIKVGAGGKGGNWFGHSSQGAIVLGNGAAYGDSGAAGESSILTFGDSKNKTETELIVATGGGAGGRASGYNTGGPGGGGNVTKKTGSGTYWWPLPCTQGSTLHQSCWLNGASGGTYQHAGGSTAAYVARITDNSNYYSRSGMYFTLGNKSGGAAGQGEAPGGGASWFANGGAGGGAASYGNHGSLGSGGGGGRFTYAGHFIGIFVIGMAIVSLAIQGGGNGGDGCLRLYY